MTFVYDSISTKAIRLSDPTPLRTFLEASSLSTDATTDDGKGEDIVRILLLLVWCSDTHAPQAVTLSTCHAAKGLEWGVVFVPGGNYIYDPACFHHSSRVRS